MAERHVLDFFAWLWGSYWDPVWTFVGPVWPGVWTLAKIVVIAVPLFEHYAVTRDSLQAGKHTLCEKRLVFKPEEIHALRALKAQYPKLKIDRVGTTTEAARRAVISSSLVGRSRRNRGEQRCHISRRQPPSRLAGYDTSLTDQDERA